MTPYFQDSSVTIYHGDARELVFDLPRADYVTIADPPYGETKLKWDRWPKDWPNALSAVSKTMWCFGSCEKAANRMSQSPLEIA